MKYTLQSSNLIKHNTCDNKATLLDLHLSISNDIVSTKIYDRRDDFLYRFQIFAPLLTLILKLSISHF